MREYQIPQTEPLTPEREHELAIAARAGDKAAMDQLVEANLPLVVSFARECAGNRPILDDLVAEGALALVEAVRSFDPGMGTRLATHVTLPIRGAIHRAMRNAGPLDISQHGMALVKQARKAHRTLAQEQGRMPRSAEVAELLGLSPSERRTLARAEKAHSPPVRGVEGHDSAGLEIPDRSSLEDLAHDEEHEGFALPEDARERLTRAQAMVMSLRYPLDGSPGLTRKQAARILGCTRENLRQREERALAKVRRAIAGEPEPPRPRRKATGKASATPGAVRAC